MKRLSKAVLVLFLPLLLAASSDPGPIDGQGCFRGVFLGGRVKVVSKPVRGAIRVRVGSRSDAHLFVYAAHSSFRGSRLGEWVFVGPSDAADFSVMFVNQNEDIRIHFVDRYYIWPDGRSAMTGGW